MKVPLPYRATVLFALYSLPLQAQFEINKAWLNEIQFAMGADSRLFQMDDYSPLSHVLGIDSAHFFNFASPWMLAETAGEIAVSASLPANSELWPGPIDTLTGVSRDPYDWNQVWLVSRAEVDAHLKLFNKKGYQIPAGIAEWPARHSDQNLPSYLAPFADWNRNGIYDPENGDFPWFTGDRIAYSISNDQYGEHLNSGARKLQVEQHLLLYSLAEPGFERILFGKLTWVNRSRNDYKPFYGGFYMDARLGNPSDNRMATDVGLNYLCLYNGDDEDEGVGGFGNSRPYGMLIFLNRDVYASTGFDTTDQIRDLPANGSEFLQIAEGRWRDGSDKVMSGDGTGSGEPTRYMFPGNSDPAHPASTWHDEDQSSGSGVRIGLINYKSEVLPTGSFEELHFAWVFDTGFVDKKAADQMAMRVHNRYRSLLGIQKSLQMDGLPLNVFPNPACGNCVINLNGEYDRIVLIDMLGRQYQADYKVDDGASRIIPLTTLQAGFYYIRTWDRMGLQGSARFLISEK